MLPVMVVNEVREKGMKDEEYTADPESSNEPALCGGEHPVRYVMTAHVHPPRNMREAALQSA